MVEIDCDIVLVDGPDMMRQCDQLEMHSDRVDYVLHMWHLENRLDRIMWDESFDCIAYFVCSEMLKFKTKLEGIRDFLQGKPQTRLVAGTLNTCNHLLDVLHEKLLDIAPIVEVVLERRRRNR